MQNNRDEKAPKNKDTVTEANKEKAEKDEAAKKKREIEEQARRDEEKLEIAIVQKKMDRELAMQKQGWFDEVQFQVYQTSINEKGKVIGEYVDYREESTLPLEGAPPNTQAVLSFGDDEQAKLMPTGQTYAWKKDNRYKLFLDENGGTKCVDRDQFSPFRPFSNKKYCEHVYALHKSRGDKVVIIDWDDPTRITEAVIMENIKAAIKNGIEVKLGTNAEKFIKSNNIYKADSQSNKLVPKSIGIEEGDKRRRRIEIRLNESKESREQNEQNMQIPLDQRQAEKYSKKNANDLAAFQDSKKNQEIEKSKDELDKIDISDEAGRESFMTKSEAIMNEITKRYEKIEEIEKRLNKEKELYERQETEMDKWKGNKEKLNDIQKILPADDSLRGMNRKELIKQLEQEREDLNEHKEDIVIINSRINSFYQGKDDNALPEADKKIKNERLPAVSKQQGELAKKDVEVENKIKKISGEDYQQKIDVIKEKVAQEINLSAQKKPH